MKAVCGAVAACLACVGAGTSAGTYLSLIFKLLAFLFLLLPLLEVLVLLVIMMLLVLLVLSQSQATSPPRDYYRCCPQATAAITPAVRDLYELVLA